MGEFTPVRSWSFSRSSKKNLVVFKVKNSDFEGTQSVNYFPTEEKRMQRCGLVWPVEKLCAEYLDGVWLQKVNYTRTSIAAGALWANMWAEKGALASGWSWPGHQWCWSTKLEGISWNWLQNYGAQGETLKDHSSSCALACFKKTPKQQKTTQPQITFMVRLKYSCKRFPRGQWVIPDMYHFLPCIFCFKHFDYLQMNWSKIESFSVRKQYNLPVCYDRYVCLNT